MGSDQSPYLSVDPTPAAPASVPTAELRATLLDEDAPMPDRYAAMFGLRNRGGADAVSALAESFSARSALLKHEVAYVLGQMQRADAIPILRHAHVLTDFLSHAAMNYCIQRSVCTDRWQASFARQAGKRDGEA